MIEVTIDIVENVTDVDINVTLISDGSFTQSQIDHTVILNRGIKTHTEIDNFINTAEATIEKSVREGSVWSPAQDILSEGIWSYSTSTTIEDPGSGNVRLNNADLSLATKAVMSKTTNQGVDFSSILDDLTVNSILNLREFSDVGNYLVSTITSITDNGTWLEADISVLGASSFSGAGADTIIRVLMLSDVTKMGNELEVVLAGSSLAASQEPLVTNSPITVEFGAASGGINDPVQIDSLGNITFNEAGNYILRIAVHFGRSGSSGTSELRLRSVINGSQIGETVGESITSSSEVKYISVSLQSSQEIGDVLHFELMRDSSGNNSGGLFQLSVNPLDWSAAPSARILIQRFV
jgi:hypothetical protein